jgi:hypothetical protein
MENVVHSFLSYTPAIKSLRSWFILMGSYLMLWLVIGFLIEIMATTLLMVATIISLAISDQATGGAALIAHIPQLLASNPYFEWNLLQRTLALQLWPGLMDAVLPGIYLTRTALQHRTPHRGIYYLAALAIPMLSLSAYTLLTSLFIAFICLQGFHAIRSHSDMKAGAL